MPIHTDESTHSFVLALNEDYEGGGTHFFDHDKTVKLRTGDMLSFRGDSLWHGGEALTAGTRYIMAVFLYHDDDGKPLQQSGLNKRPRGNLSQSFQKTKDQKTEFTFGFHLEK